MIRAVRVRTALRILSHQEAANCLEYRRGDHPRTVVGAKGFAERDFLALRLIEAVESFPYHPLLVAEVFCYVVHA
jgi:hypothetical protein